MLDLICKLTNLQWNKDLIKILHQCKEAADLRASVKGNECLCPKAGPGVLTSTTKEVCRRLRLTEN